MFRKNVYRNPVYIVYVLVGVTTFLLSVLLVDDGTGLLEVGVFRFFNNMGDWAYPIFLFLSTLGSIGFAWFAAIVFLGLKKYTGALKVFLATTLAYAMAYGLKQLAIRERPFGVLEDVNIREHASSYGIPSGHAAVATALALIMYQYIPAKYHWLITFAAIGVYVSRMYLGVHLPVDLAAGLGVGLVAGSIVSYLLGSKQDSKISPRTIKQKLASLGFRVKSIYFLNGDARGSVPYIFTDEDGKKYFIKVVSQDNYISDWLFKMWRRVVYRRLEDESPFLSPKRQIEHESYVAGLAHNNGVTTPLIYGVFKAGENSWGQIQQGINGKSLDDYSKTELSDKILTEVWLEVKKLHDANIIHRDLRAANVFVDDMNNPWIIDFGFGESSIEEVQLYRDIVELIASTAVIVGPKKAVSIACKVEGKERIKAAAPYMSYDAMSSATTKLMKQQKGLINDVQSQMKIDSGAKDAKPMRLKRVNMKILLIIAAMLLAVYAIVPQLGAFRASVDAIRGANISFIALSMVFSLGTYFAATMVYKTLAVHHLPLFRTLVVQFSSSFTNRLLPASTGGLATFGRYLYKQGHTTTQAGALLAINNFLGLTGLIIWMVVVGVVTKTPLSDIFSFSLPSYFFIVIAALAVIVLAVLGFLPKVRAKIAKAIKAVRKDIAIVAAQPVRLIVALFWSMVITALYASVMFIVIHALGQEATMMQALMVMTIGVVSAAVTPTPGGIGGAEAGLTAALASIGIGVEIGLGIALVYRFVTYWLPILPGFLFFQLALKKKYI